MTCTQANRSARNWNNCGMAAAAFLAGLMNLHMPSTTYAYQSSTADDLCSMLSASDVVVVVRVDAVATGRYNDHGIIVTDILGSVLHVVRGTVETGSVQRITVNGGVVDDIGLYVPGEAGFVEGEVALVFLRHSNDSWRVSMGELGKIPVLAHTDWLELDYPGGCSDDGEELCVTVSELSDCSP